jgi:hypothetical protein
MNKIDRFYFNVLCYGILVLAVPCVLLAQLFDSFIRAGADVWALHLYIGEARGRAEARIARAKA